MPEPKSHLDTLIKDYLACTIPIADFSASYSRFYLENVPDGGLSEEEFDWYGLIHEKLEWTTEAPPAVDQQFGWMSPNRFSKWLYEHLDRKPQSS
jgi:hypothetical protein